jgi:exopolysaccharide biosynthesis protein PssK
MITAPGIEHGREPGGAMQHLETIQRLRETIVEAFRPILDGGGPFVLVDFPDAANAGDHAIWLGEKVLLKSLGIDVAYECSMQSYSAAKLKEAVGSGTILMHGGGNFGDLYVYHHFRHQVLKDFPHNRVVIFPQTVMFYDDAALKASVASFAAHGNVTIAARDVLSAHTLDKFFGSCARVITAPDMAFMMEPRPRLAKPFFDVLWLSRIDQEGVYGASIAGIPGIGQLQQRKIRFGVFDDGIETIAAADVADTRLMVTDWYRCSIPDEGGRAAYDRLGFDGRSRFWVNRAARLLSIGHVVVTDRLHAHILCLLSGIPHVLLNNSYGKNVSFYESWCRPLQICRLARSPVEAWSLASELAKRSGAGRAETDVARWSNADNLNDAWRHRSERAATHVRDNATLLDLGCGKMMIETLLPANCRYVPVDVVRRDERTVVCDFNKGEFPPAGAADHISLLGVLEYVNDPQAVWQWLGGVSARLILAYVPLRPSFPIERRAVMGWRNHLTRDEVLQAAAVAGFALAAEEEIPPDTVLFVFDKSVTPPFPRP